MAFLLGAVFLGVLALSFAIFAVMAKATPYEKAVQKRLGQLALAHPPGGGGSDGSGELLKQTASEQFAWLDRLLAPSSLATRLQLLIEQANAKTTVAKLLLLSLGLGAAGFVLPCFLLRLPLLGAGLAAAAAAPVMSLRMRRARRLKAFNDALPGSIDLMSRALRAGHSVASAIQVVGEEGQEPAATEFSQVYQQQNFGLPFREALMQMARRVPSSDLRFVITAMLVQKDTGGNLTEILDRTVYVIRERLRIQGEVRIKTAQGRLTGWILTLLPVILGLIISVIDPGYAKPLFDDPVGGKLLYAGVGMLATGGLIIRKIVRIEV